LDYRKVRSVTLERLTQRASKCLFEKCRFKPDDLRSKLVQPNQLELQVTPWRKDKISPQLKKRATLKHESNNATIRTKEIKSQSTAPLTIS
jgi:hypothetical protein